MNDVIKHVELYNSQSNGDARKEFIQDCKSMGFTFNNEEEIHNFLYLKILDLIINHQR